MKGSRHSLTTLRIFLEAARSLNFSRSAEVLNLTQSAVSKHMGALESRLGVALFKRTATGLRLTHAGAVYLERIGAAVRLIDEADAMVAQPHTRVDLNIGVSPSFAQFCLIPGLNDFFTLHPEVRVNVRPRLLSATNRTERFDAEIHLHSGSISGMSAQYLCGREMTLVGAAALLADRPVRSVSDLHHVPLLKRAQRGYGWDEWRAQVAPQWAGPAQTAPEYEGFSVLLPAVLNGLGVAIVPLCMVVDYLQTGQLVRPLGETVVGRYGYYLMQPRPNVSGPYADAFCIWIQERAASLERHIQALQ